MTMTLVSTVTVGAGGAGTMSFSNIPQSGTDLLLLVSARSTNNLAGLTYYARLNGSAANAYVHRSLIGNGTNPSSDTATNTYIYMGNINQAGNTANTFNSTALYISNYTSSNQKSMSLDTVTENNATQAFQHIHALLWQNTAAITSIDVSEFNNSFAQGTTASLYIITKGSGGATVS